MQDAIVSLAIFKAFLGTLENEYGLDAFPKCLQRKGHIASKAS